MSKVIPFDKRPRRTIDVGANDTFDIDAIVRRMADPLGKGAKSAKVAAEIEKRNAALEPPRKLSRTKREVY